jgi:hypothetical protein
MLIETGRSGGRGEETSMLTRPAGQRSGGGTSMLIETGGWAGSAWSMFPSILPWRSSGEAGSPSFERRRSIGRWRALGAPRTVEKVHVCDFRE